MKTLDLRKVGWSLVPAVTVALGVLLIPGIVLSDYQQDIAAAEVAVWEGEGRYQAAQGAFVQAQRRARNICRGDMRSPECQSAIAWERQAQREALRTKAKLDSDRARLGGLRANPPAPKIEPQLPVPHIPIGPQVQQEPPAPQPTAEPTAEPSKNPGPRKGPKLTPQQIKEAERFEAFLNEAEAERQGLIVVENDAIAAAEAEYHAECDRVQEAKAGMDAHPDEIHFWAVFAAATIRCDQAEANFEAKAAQSRRIIEFEQKVINDIRAQRTESMRRRSGQ